MRYLFIAALAGAASLSFAHAQTGWQSASEAGVRASYPSCLDAAGKDVPDWFSCTEAEFKFQDARLNLAYKALMAKLPGSDKAALRSSERTWIEARDQRCAIDGNGFEGRSLTSNDCVLQLTARRASDLEKARYGEIPASFAWKTAIASFVGAGRKVVAYQVGFLGESTNPGVLLVLDRAPAVDKEASRSVILAAPDGQGQLQSIAENDKLVPCAACAGLRGDPWGFARIADGRFFLTVEGGARDRWSSVYVFAYEPAQEGWYLSEVRRAVSDTANGRGKQQRLTAKDFGAIRFEAFDPAKLPSFNLE